MKISASDVMKWCGIISMSGVFVLALVAAYQWLRANPMYVHYVVVLLGLVILFAVLGVLLMPGPPKPPKSPTYRKGRGE